MATREQFATAVLVALGAPDTANNRIVLLAAMAAQEPPGAGPANNPLCTELNGYGGTAWNVAGVQSYPTMADGVAATVATLELSYYRDVVTSLLQSGPASQTARAWMVSPWGTGNLLALVGQVSADYPAYASPIVPGSDGPPGTIGAVTTSTTGGDTVPVTPPAPPVVAAPLSLVAAWVVSGGHEVKIIPQDLPPDVPALAVTYRWVSPAEVLSLPEGTRLWTYAMTEQQDVASGAVVAALEAGWTPADGPVKVLGATG